MEFDFVLFGRITLLILSISVLGFIIKARLSNRLGNQFFSIMGLLQSRSLLVTLLKMFFFPHIWIPNYFSQKKIILLYGKISLLISYQKQIKHIRSLPG